MDKNIQQLTEMLAELPLIREAGVSLFCQVPVRSLARVSGAEVPPLEDKLPVVVCRKDEVLFFFCFTAFVGSAYQGTKEFYDKNLPGLERLFLDGQKFSRDKKFFRAELEETLSALSDKLIEQRNPPYRLKAEPITAHFKRLGLSEGSILPTLTINRLLTVSATDGCTSYDIGKFGEAVGLVRNIKLPLSEDVGNADAVKDYIWVTKGSVSIEEALQFNAVEKKEAQREKLPLEERIARMHRHLLSSPGDAETLCRMIQEFFRKSAEDYFSPCPDFLSGLLRLHPEVKDYSAAELIKFATAYGGYLLFDCSFPLRHGYSRTGFRQGISVPQMPAYLVFYAAAVKMNSSYPLWEYERNLESWLGERRLRNKNPTYGELVSIAHLERNEHALYKLLKIPLKPFCS